MKKNLKKIIDLFFPDFIRRILKKIFLKIIFCYNRSRYINKGKKSEFGAHFRFSRDEPFKANMGENVCTDEFNIWNAKGGNIIIGNNCWFGIRNIVMGPVEIGNNVETGPNVSILGPRHAVYGYNNKKDGVTKIGNNVWISTGSIIHFGVTIGNNVIISPGSVVTKDIADKAIVAGNPARDITKLVPFQRENKNGSNL